MDVRRTAVQPPRGPVNPDVLAFCHEVLRRAGLAPDAYRPEPLARRYPSVLRTLGASSASEALTRIDREPDRLRAAVNGLLIGVTWFYRDESVIESLRRQIVEATTSAEPRVWSAGCSDGAELYTMAMLLAEAGRLGQGALLGTDCRPEAIEAARGGCYPPERVERLPHGWSNRYLRPRAGRWHVSEPLRAACRWQVHDLFRQPPVHESFDIVLCRNVVIYLTPSSARELWRRLIARIVPDGLLVVGKAERLDRSMGVERIGPCLYRKR